MSDEAPEKIDPAMIFRSMALRIERNTPEEFQGAFVILTPDGVVLSNAVFDPVGDPEGFWALLQTAIERQKEVYRG